MVSLIIILGAMCLGVGVLVLVGVLCFSLYKRNKKKTPGSLPEGSTREEQIAYKYRQELSKVQFDVKALLNAGIEQEEVYRIVESVYADEN